MKRIKLSDEKLRNSIIYFVKNTRYLGVTKLMKLLYFLDFFHYSNTGRSVTGLRYHAWDLGPVPVDVWTELRVGNGALHLDTVVKTEKKSGRNGNEFIAIKAVEPSASVDEDVFTDRELHFLQQVSEVFRDSTAEQMVEATHLPNHPWDVTFNTKGKDVLIDYELALIGVQPPEVIDNIREWQDNRLEVEGILDQL